jgi:uracil-DNA glycosylase
MAPHSPCLVRSILPLTTDSCRPRRLVQGAPSPGRALSNTLGLMVEPARILDRLAGDERIAPDWVAGLRAVDPGIDSKIDTCLASFSTRPAGDIPDSLANIYAELAAVGYPTPGIGDLSAWSAQGVMLLNRSLTLPRDKQARPKRHIRMWSPLAVAAMKAIRAEAEARPIAAMLWGVPSHRMRQYLEPEVAVFASSHPSPMSVQRTAGAERSFRGSNPFGEVNRWFESRSASPIDWTIAN